MLFFPFFSLLLLFSLSLSQLFEDPELVKPIDTYQEIDQIRSGKSDNLNCIFYHTKKCPRCEQTAPAIEKLAKNYLDIVNVYDVNCHTLWRDLEENEKSQVSVCDPKNKDKMPQIQFFQVPTRKINPYTNQPMRAMETPYNGEATAFGLSDFAASMIPSFRTFVGNKKDLNNFLRYKKIPTKVILFTDRDDTPISFRGMTSMFRDRLDFAEVRKNGKEVIDQYEVENFPTLLVLKLNANKQYEKEMYTGEYKFDKIKEWLEPFALEKKVNRDEGSSKDDEDSSGETESAIPDLKPKEFEKQVLGQEKMVLIHVFKNEEASSFADIRKKFGSMVEYYELKCIVPSNEKFAKETLEVKKFPSFKLYPPGAKKATYKYNFDGDIELKDFLKEVSDVIEDDSTPLNEKDLQMFMSSAFQEEKIPVILFHETRETFISFRTFTHMNKFTEKFKFFSLRNPSQKMMKDFNINQIPKLVALVKPVDADSKKGGVQIAQYTGRFNYGDMSKFMDSLGGTEPEVSASKKHTKRMKQINNQDDFEKTCLKTSFCFVGFFDSSNKDSEIYRSKLEILELVKDKYANRPITFAWIDGICHHYLMPRVNIQEEILPQLVAYNPSKNQYVNQIGTFEVDSLSQFVDKVLKGKVEAHTLKEDIDIDEVNCQEVFDAREKKRKEMEEAKTEEDDEILREILEEERLRKQKIQEELDKENKKSKKKKDKKKSDL